MKKMQDLIFESNQRIDHSMQRKLINRQDTRAAAFLESLSVSGLENVLGTLLLYLFQLFN